MHNYDYPEEIITIPELRRENHFSARDWYQGVTGIRDMSLPDDDEFNDALVEIVMDTISKMYLDFLKNNCGNLPRTMTGKTFAFFMSEQGKAIMKQHLVLCEENNSDHMFDYSFVSFTDCLAEAYNSLDSTSYSSVNDYYRTMNMTETTFIQSGKDADTLYVSQLFDKFALSSDDDLTLSDVLINVSRFVEECLTIYNLNDPQAGDAYYVKNSHNSDFNDDDAIKVAEILLKTDYRDVNWAEFEKNMI